jgi:hypothetical protein
VNAIEITLEMAVKVWWSYVWRAFVLLVPVMIVAMILMFSIFPFPTPGHAGAPLQPAQIPALMRKLSLVWLFMMSLSVLLHILAVKWMLKTRWSDFRLVAVPPGE